MELKRIILFATIFLILFFNISFSSYLISKDSLEKILKKSSFISLSNLNFKCYFDRICVFDKPIKGFENYFVKDQKIFKIHRVESLSILDAYRIWNTSFENLNLTGSNIKIAILDTGIDIYHKDLNYSLDTWKCFYSIGGNKYENNWTYCNDDHWHGTFIAGIIAGRYDGNISKCFEGYPCGISPNATLLIAKVFDKNGIAYFVDILNGLEWAVNNSANIISMSFGIDLSILNLSTCYPTGASGIEKIIFLINNFIDFIAVKYNIIPVASAGNNPDSFSSPACTKNVIAVGAIDKNKNIASFSSRGPIDGRIKPDLVAPGASINSTFIANSYSLSSGTSFSTPFVSGAVALLLEALNKENIKISSQEIKALILTSPNEIERNNIIGSGILNVSELIRIRKNFITIRSLGNETLTFLVNKSDNYPFKFTIYRNEFFNQSNLISMKIIKDDKIIYQFNSSDNVIQYKNESLNDIFLIVVTILNPTNITFASSHKFFNLTEFVLNNFLLKNSIASTVSIEIEEPIELKLNPKTKYFKFSIRDFFGRRTKVDKVIINISNYTSTVEFREFRNVEVIEFNATNITNPGRYTLTIFAERETIFGFKRTHFEFLPIEFFSPKEFKKLMNGDILNLTFKIDNININISNAYLFLKNDRNINISLNFLNNSLIFYNISQINLSKQGEYYLFLNITSNDQNFQLEIPLFYFSPIFEYNFSFTSEMFADKEYYFNLSVFHINGTILNITKSICLLNESSIIFCNVSLSNTIRIFTNISANGYYNLSINVIDSFGNHLLKNFSSMIEFLPDKILINMPDKKLTIFKPLDISFSIINSSKNSICSFCKVYLNITKNNTSIVSNTLAEYILGKNIPKDWESGIYNFTFFAIFNPIIVVNHTLLEIQNLDILTNVSQKIFPNYKNVTVNISVNEISNISINITKINITGTFQISPDEINIISGCNQKIFVSNMIWCNQTSNIIFQINSSETATFLLEIYAYGNETNGYLLDKFYSGFLIRPKDLERFSCDDIRSEDKFINKNIKNHCFTDSKDQKDLSINKNEKIKFVALPYAGATRDLILPLNVSLEVKYRGMNIFSNISNFDSLVYFEISNFTNTGIYLVNLTYSYYNGEINISKGEIYEIKVFEFNFSYKSIKNYTKVNDIIIIVGVINRTDSYLPEIPENIGVESLLKDISISSYAYNSTNGNITINLKFNNPFNGNVTIKLTDELGIEGIVNLTNLTAYKYSLDLTLQNTIDTSAILGLPFVVKVSSRLLPFNMQTQSNFSILVSGGCDIIGGSIQSNKNEAVFNINATSVGSCLVTIFGNSTYLDLFFSDSISKEIQVISLSSKDISQQPFPQIIYNFLLIRKISEELLIKENSWNTSIIFVTSIGRDQNVFAYVLDYPSHLINIIPKNQTIKANEELPFLINISIDPNENRSKFEITFVFNSSYASNQTKIKVLVLKTKINETEKQSLINEIIKLEEEIGKLEELVVKYQKKDLLDNLLEARNLLNLAKNELQNNNLNKTNEYITQINRVINFVKNALESETKEKEKSNQVNIYPIFIVIISIIVGGAVLFFIYPKIKFKKPYYDVKKQKFVWSKEDESVWQKLKEKWKKKT